MMKSVFTRTLAILLVVLLLLSLSACGGKKDKKSASAETSSIVGSWKHTPGNFIYHFKENGTGSYAINENTTMYFTYETDDTTLSITYEGMSEPLVLEYSIEGDALNLKDSYGASTIYQRVNH